MSKIIVSLISFAIFLISSISYAQNFDDLTEDNKFELFLDSCEKGQPASCYEVGTWYQRNQRLDPIEVKEIRHKISAFNDLRKTRDLTEEEAENLLTQRTKLTADAQKAKATALHLDYVRKACSGGETHACKELNGTSVYVGSEVLFWGGIGLIGLAIFLVAKTIFQDEDEFQAQEKLDDAKVQVDDLKKQDIVLRYSRPFFKRYFSPIVSGMKSKKKFKEKYRRTLASAGMTNILTPEDFFAYKLFLIVGFPILFLLVRTFLEETWPLEYIPVVALVGFYYPDFSINSTIEKRKKDVLRAMPFCVDMLALSVEAGLDFVAAMAKVIEKAKDSPLTEELDILIREIKIGASRAEALRNLAWRIDLIQMSSFSATLIAADSVGASIGPILKALSEEIRQKKSADAEKQGATAATKILIPMMFFIIPSVFIVIFAPIILEAVYGAK